MKKIVNKVKPPTEPAEQAAPTAQANVKTDEATKRANRLWRLYCARVSAADPLHDMRGLKKILRDEFKVAVAALEVFEDEILKGGK